MQGKKERGKKEKIKKRKDNKKIQTRITGKQSRSETSLEEILNQMRGK